MVLEVGIGSGLNLPFYTNASRACTASIGLRSCSDGASDLTAAAPFPVELRHRYADRISLATRTVDTVVVTWSLCSIDNVAVALADMRRVLKPGGTLIFVEHGLAPDAGVRKWQNRLTPLWRPLAGGCHLNRKMDDLVRGAGFTIADLQTAYVPGPRPLTFMYQGSARKNG